MRVLIAVASRHGSTYEIAEVIAAEVRAAGDVVDLRAAEDVDSLESYDAVVLGSAVYMGKWLPEARQFVTRHRARLAAIPVWLFCSGPLGHDDPKPAGDPAGLDDLIQATQARGHRIFSGKLDMRGLGMGERLIVRMVKAPEGDIRDWDAIRAWAREIATELPLLAGSAG